MDKLFTCDQIYPVYLQEQENLHLKVLEAKIKNI